MKNKTVYIGIDVDDQAFHGCALVEDGEEIEFKCKPNVGELVKKLDRISKRYKEIKSCYESTYLGFSLQRDLGKRGYECDVIASSLIPMVSGQRAKTDRLDCRKLARYYMKGELTRVHVPSEEEEAIRDLVRGRVFLRKQLKAMKLYIQSTCRRIGIHYRESKGATKSYWTQSHKNWLDTEIGKMKDRAQKFNLRLLREQLDQLTSQIELYDQEIKNIAQTPKYARKVDALSCYRGINTLTAMTLITELGDIKRFDHPRRLASYSGMDLREYSSGGRERRYGITKMGNRYIRTSIVESCQTVFNPPIISKRLKQQREGVDSQLIDIADRCMKRLYKKSSRMLYAGKARNKIKVACGREMLCFVWESLRAAA